MSITPSLHNRVRKLEEQTKPRQWRLVDMLRACVAREKELAAQKQSEKLK